jgi:hypothetical protein
MRMSSPSIATERVPTTTPSLLMTSQTSSEARESRQAGAHNENVPNSSHGSRLSPTASKRARGAVFPLLWECTSVPPPAPVAKPAQPVPDAKVEANELSPADQAPSPDERFRP